MSAERQLVINAIGLMNKRQTKKLLKLNQSFSPQKKPLKKAKIVCKEAVSDLDSSSLSYRSPKRKNNLNIGVEHVDTHKTPFIEQRRKNYNLLFPEQQDTQAAKENLLAKQDDPFVNLFLEVKKPMPNVIRGSTKLQMLKKLGKSTHRASVFNKVHARQSSLSILRSQKSSKVNSSNSHSDEEHEIERTRQLERQKEMQELEKNLLDLPENVRNAIMLAEAKKKHSTFWYQLCSLNDKIRVFTSIFYNKRQFHEKLYDQKKI